MRRNSSYFRTRNTHDSPPLGEGNDEIGKSRTQIEDDLISSVVEGMWSSDDERDDRLSFDLSGLTKSEKELAAEQREREREDLAERIAEKLVEKTREFERREAVSKEETPDPVETCERTLDVLDELIERTEDNEELDR